MLEVICGCMSSGKSEELIRRLHRAVIAKQRVVAFKADIDDRYDSEAIASHAGRTFEAKPLPCSSPELLLHHVLRDSVVGLDEAQFFDKSAVPVIRHLARISRVIVAGLDLDFAERPFGIMGDLLAMATKVTKLQAVCMVCGGEATRTQRLGESTELVVVGGLTKYEARCTVCYQPPKYA